MTEHAGYALRMSDEIHEWLADLHRSDPPAAARVRQALAALITEGASLADPLVASTAGAWPWALLDALDRSYQEQLERMQVLRRQAVQAGGLSEASRQQHERTDAFRIRKEVLKASYQAAHYGLLVDQAIGPPDSADDAAGAIAGAQARLAGLTAEIERELEIEGWPAGLMELRPGAPASDGIRIFFAPEPAATALLIAVLDGPEAVRDHYHEAVLLSADVLHRVRAGLAPEAAARAYDDPGSFLQEFDPP